MLNLTGSRFCTATQVPCSPVALGPTFIIALVIVASGEGYSCGAGVATLKDVSSWAGSPGGEGCPSELLLQGGL